MALPERYLHVALHANIALKNFILAKGSRFTGGYGIHTTDIQKNFMLIPLVTMWPMGGGMMVI